MNDNPIGELELLHLEMGNLIKELSVYDSVLDDSFYKDIIRDYSFDNRMLSFHLKSVKRGDI